MWILFLAAFFAYSLLVFVAGKVYGQQVADEVTQKVDALETKAIDTLRRAENAAANERKQLVSEVVNEIAEFRKKHNL